MQDDCHFELAIIGLTLMINWKMCDCGFRSSRKKKRYEKFALTKVIYNNKIDYAMKHVTLV